MKLLLTTLNAKYTHSSLALRYLREYCIELPLAIEVKEFSINQQVLDILGQIYEEKPDIIGFSCYIWNINMTLDLIALIKKVLPKAIIICGGPEVSYESTEFLQAHTNVDYLVHGEGEDPFYRLLCRILGQGQFTDIHAVSYRKGSGGMVQGGAVVADDLDRIPFPYREEEMEGLREKIIYYESSRGCPFACRYCLSSATRGVRFFNVERVLQELRFFIRHDVRQVKFVDRTFNTKKEHYLTLWRFLAKQECRTNFHFEIAVDLLDAEALAVLKTMPEGRIQLEIGIQSTNETTLKAINRNNDWEKIVFFVRELSSFGNMHLHLDLIVGLPEESYALFQRSFNDVYALKPEMLQIGFLKFLKGAEIQSQAEHYDYIFMDSAPYQVLGSSFMSYEEIRRLQIFEEVFEQYYNSGRFRNTTEFLVQRTGGDAFRFYEELSQYWRERQLHLMAHTAKRLYGYLFDFCQRYSREEVAIIKQLLKFDALCTDKASILPDFLPWSETAYYENISAFWRSDHVKCYLPDFSFTNWRDLKKKYRIEIFDFSLVEWRQTRKIVAGRKAYLFSYGEKVTFQEIEDSDFML